MHHLALKLYGDLLVRTICNTIYGDPPGDQWNGPMFRPELRAIGRDWPSKAHSMIGTVRMESLRCLTEMVIEQNIPGDFIETGVWRGGSCILMRGLLAAHGDTSRKVIVADSFRGLPNANIAAYPADAEHDFTIYPELSVSLHEVKENFAAYDLLDGQVEFLEGWFRDTLPTLDNRTFALIRLDGDMYESTMDGLVNLYDRLSPGGVLIVDDYGAVPACKQAVDDYREANGITVSIEAVDWTGIWWRKPT